MTKCCTSFHALSNPDHLTTAMKAKIIIESNSLFFDRIKLSLRMCFHDVKKEKICVHVQARSCYKLLDIFIHASAYCETLCVLHIVELGIL